MVTKYDNVGCRYTIQKLDNIVYLINEEALKNIVIDNGEAYISSISQEPIYLHCFNISLEDGETLDERYEFSHTVKFSVNGYANFNDFQGRYYIIVKTVNNEFWLVNPLFPCKVTYQYTLGQNESHTDFTLSTISNHPTLRCWGMEQARPYECKDYARNGIDRIFLNEKKYSNFKDNVIFYTNDGFKEIKYNKNSPTFTEDYDGENVAHTLKFNINFGDYKSGTTLVSKTSWHYNLLEFVDNLYAAVISTKANEFVLCGFGFGLQPSYSVSSSDGYDPDFIEITLTDLHSTGHLITFQSGGTISGLTETTFQYTSDYDAWECVSDGYAKYLLQKEVDTFQNPTGKYKCLSGYQSRFSFLGTNLIGTFDDIVTFRQPLCNDGGCKLKTSLISPIRTYGMQCKDFTIECDTDWSISTDASYLTFIPNSGVSNSAYTVQICNSRPTSALTVTTSFTINYCSTAQTYQIVIGKGSQCFPSGQGFTVGAEGGWVEIPTNCCVSGAWESSSALSNVQLTNDMIKVYVPANTSNSSITYDIVAQLCDSSQTDITINQQYGYYRWVREGYTCRGTDRCEVQRMYSGETADDINTYTTVTRITGCSPSDICGGVITRWQITTATTCSDGKKYYIEKEQRKSSIGSYWEDTGNERLGNETADSPSECSGATIYQWVLTSGTTCVSFDKYRVYQKQWSIDGGTTWNNVVPTTLSYDGDGTQTPQLEESGSTDCGYEPEVEPQYKWVNIAINEDYICDYCPTYRTLTSGWTCIGNDKYELDEYQVSLDGGQTWETTGSSATTLIESGSSDCGYDNRTLTTGWTCVGVDKYTLAEYQVSYDFGETWETTATGVTTLISANSTDCGYSARTLTTGWTCDGVNKYQLDEYQISTDYGQSWTTTATSATTLIEANAEDCGYIPPTPIDYSTQYLTFEAIDDCTFKFSGRTTAHTISYSLDSGATWNVPSANTQSIRYVDVQAGNKVMWKQHYYLAAGDKIGQFSVTNGGRFNVEGNIMSLFYGDSDLSAKTDVYVSFCFKELFSGCTTIINATNLVLPATSVTSSSYSKMFYGCTSLQTAPKILPAMRLGDNCYYYMFYSCTSLTVAPELPATTFTISENSCYDGMFHSCSNLSYIKALFTTTPSSTYMSNWVSGVASSGTFVKNSEATWTSSCGVSTYPCNWTITDNSN